MSAWGSGQRLCTDGAGDAPGAVSGAWPSGTAVLKGSSQEGGLAPAEPVAAVCTAPLSKDTQLCSAQAGPGPRHPNPQEQEGHSQGTFTRAH